MSKVFIKVMLELQTYSGPASNNYDVLLRLVLSLLCFASGHHIPAECCQVEGLRHHR